MRIGRITVAAVAAATMIASGAGLATASASTIRQTAASGTEHFSLMTTQPSASKYTIIASGLFTAGGVDLSGSKADLARLPGGTFKIDHGGQIHIVKQSVNPKTCLAQFVATTKFTLGAGTGAYKGITGSGKATLSGLGIAPRAKGKCNPNGTPLAWEQTITASAHVTL
jgi:hypothetical protein